MVFSKEEFREKTKYLCEGFEAKLFIYEDLLLKKYFDINEKGFSNVVEKIKLFLDIKIDGVLTPSDLVIIDNEIVGYAMTYMKDCVSIGSIKDDLDIETKYKILKKISKILEELHKKNIVYGDLNVDNILTNGSDVYLGDIVNAKINDYNFSEKTITMNNYINDGGSTDKLFDCYMLNILTIYLLNDVSYKNVLPLIEDQLEKYFNKKSTEYIIGISDNLNCMDICYNLIDPKKMNSELLINHIDIEKFIENKKTL